MVLRGEPALSANADNAIIGTREDAADPYERSYSTYSTTTASDEDDHE